MILAILFSLFSTVTSAQPLTGATFRDFSGGYVDTVESTNLQPNQSPSALNVIVDDPVGSVRPRSGLSLCGATPSGNAPTNLYAYTKSDGTRNLLVTDNATVWTTQNCQSYTTIVSGLSAAAQVYFTTVRDKVWIVNGSTWPYTWDGTTATPLDGRANTPSNAPKCAYPEFWRERVWCARTLGGQSALYFTALTDTNGNDIDPSTHTASFPAINVFQIDQNGGSPIYAVRAYRDRLYVCKDNGIWEVQFNSEFENSIRKTASSVGCRFNSAFREVDGILYFVGRDGIYAFDGDAAVRISEPIQNKFYTLTQPQTSESRKIWDSQSEFAAGTSVQTSTTLVPGSIVITTGAISSGLNSGFELGDATNWTYSTTNTGCCTTTPGSFGSSYASCTSIPSAATTADASLGGSYLGKLSVNACSTSSALPTSCEDFDALQYTGAEYHYTVIDGNGATISGPTAVANGTNTVDLSAASTNYVRLSVALQATSTGGGRGGGTSRASAIMAGGFTTSDSFSFRATAAYDGVVTNCSSNGNFNYVIKIDDVQGITYQSTGTWTSEIYNAVAVSTWSVFDADADTNGGTIDYSIRLGRDTADISTKAWTSISAGSIIPGTTDQIYVQVKSSLTSNASNTPQINSLYVSWSNGAASSNKIFLNGWKNRVWISASSGTATTNNIALVKSRLPLNSWVPYDLQIGPMVTFSDNFYVGSSTWGAIYRADYGTSDAGRAISWYWDTRDELWNEPNRRKYLQEITTDFKKGTALNAYVGWSSDYGESFSTKQVNMSGSGRGSYRAFVNGGLQFSYRFRVGSNALDDNATVTGITGWARPSTLRE